MSYEPALGHIDLWRWLPRDCEDCLGTGEGEGGPCEDCLGGGRLGGLDWIIVGGESGPGARPGDLEWIRSIVRQCKAAGVACFVKQLGSRVRMNRFDAAGPVAFDGAGWRAEAPAAAHGIVSMLGKGGDPSVWPEDLRVREFPKPEF